MANLVGKKRLKKAIEKNFGIVTHCARDLNIGRNVCLKYIREYDLEKFRSSQREKLKDHGEGNIVTSMMGGTQIQTADSLLVEEVYQRLRIIYKEDVGTDLMKALLKLVGKLKKRTVSSSEKIETTKWYLSRQAIDRGFGDQIRNVNVNDEDERTDDEIEAENKRLEDEENANS